MKAGYQDAIGTSSSRYKRRSKGKMENNPKVNVGDVIRIIEMKGEVGYDGRFGIVTSIDGAGQLHGTWGGLAVLPDVDSYILVSPLNVTLTTNK